MPRILIVDDEPAILSLLRTILESESFEVETARSAAEAKLRLGQQHFDLVMTDMRMESPIAGYDVVRAARKLNPRPAVAILTAFPIPASDWRSSGADALMVKGMDVLSVPQKLRALLQRSQNAPVEELNKAV
jgi:DNA-binding response OmpR family regulator